MSFGLLRIEGVLRAVTPIHHGGNEKTGSVILLNRIKFLVDGEPMDIPFISGNAVRGVWRRLIFKDMLDQIGYEIDVSRKGGQKLYHAIFAGGVLETVDVSSSATIDVELKKRILSLLIPARLFGFSIGNQSIEGRLKVGHLLPICKELNEYIPAKSNKTIYEMISSMFQTRKDELKTEREKDEQAVQMLIEYEVFTAGTQFYHKVMLEDPTEIDISCLARVIELWKQKPFIGGKSSIGLGELEIDYKFDGKSDEYLDFLKKKRDEICQLLDSLSH